MFSLVGNEYAKLTLMERTSNSCDLYYFWIVLDICIIWRKEKFSSSNRSVWMEGTNVFLSLFQWKPKLLAAPYELSQKPLIFHIPWVLHQNCSSDGGLWWMEYSEVFKYLPSTCCRRSSVPLGSGLGVELVVFWRELVDVLEDVLLGVRQSA